MSARLVACVAADTVRVTAQRRGRPVWSETFGFGSSVELAGRFAGLAEPVGAHRLPRRLLVRVEPPLLQRRTLTDLPPVRESELRLLVARASARFFRQNGYPLVSVAAWTVAGVPPRRVALAAAADLELLEAIVAGARQARLQLEDIVPDTDPARRLSLLPPAEQQRRRQAQWRGTLRLAGAVGVLWLLVGGATLVARQTEMREIEAELERLREPSVALHAARVAMDSARAMVVALEEAERRRGMVAGRLAELTGALPNSASLASVAVDSTGRVGVAARAPRALAVIEALSRVPGLRPVELEGAAVPESLPGSPGERFSLRIGSHPETPP